MELPLEDEDFDKDLCGRLNAHMYDARPAADGWHTECSGSMMEFGFKIVASSACVSYRSGDHLVCSIHGDGFTTVGPKSALEKFVKNMMGKYKLQEAARLGPGADDDKEARMLCEGVATPAVRQSIDQINNDEPIAKSEIARFRAIAARCNYLAADRPECQFSTKEVCRFMSAPTKLSVEALKRFGRYLVKYPRLVFMHPFQKSIDGIDVYVDADHAGCLRTLESTSDGCVLAGSHLLKSWSSTQPTITLSSGEAELHGVVRGGAVGLGIASPTFGPQCPDSFADLDRQHSITGHLCTSGARQGAPPRCARALGAAKTSTRRFVLYKVDGDMNPGDLFTKASLTSHRIRTLLSLLGCQYMNGRSRAAPELGKDGSSTQRPFRQKDAWAEYDDDCERQYNDDEVVTILRANGLPHTRREAFIPERPKQAYPAVEEEPDPMHDDGVSMGRHDSGRSELQERIGAH